MKFNLPRLVISPELKTFALKKIKEQKIIIPKAGKKIVSGIGAVCKEIAEKGLPSYLVLKKLKGKLGYGIFLHPKAKPILRGEVIAPYAGEVILSLQYEGEDTGYAFTLFPDLLLSKEDQLLLDPTRKHHHRRLYSLDLEAYKKGNFTRFINHSEKPNIEAELLRIPKNSLGISPSPFEMVYIAKRKILPGEQLLICYEGEDKSYWGAMKIKPFPMTPKTFQINASFKIQHTMDRP